MPVRDFVIVGAGIVGLALARELKTRNPDSKILILEKEDGVGKHASGRNSGVLHSGIFYAEDSVKARVCADGGKEMRAYCLERGLPIEKTGKVILPTRPEEADLLEKLCERGKKNGINAFLVDEKTLKQIEPHAHSASGKAIHLPDVCVVEPTEILKRLARELTEKGVEIRFGAGIDPGEIHPTEATLASNGEKISFGHLFNAAGLHADRIAKAFGVGAKYAIMPFKGLYYKVSPDSGLKINGLIYAYPDPKVPFLGIHFMKKINGEIFAGPTVIPVLGRENYEGFEKLAAGEAAGISIDLFRLYLSNRLGFRTLVHKEGFRFLKPLFYAGAKRIVPDLKMRHLLKSRKVGIRAQLVNTASWELVLDFLVENGPRSTHVLNAVSPAFTSSFAFVKLVLQKADL